MPDSEVARIDRGRARVERREVVVDLHRHDGLGLVVELDVGDRADGRAAHPHLVALDELARVVEDGVDGVGAAVAEHGEGSESDGGDQRRDSYDAGRSRSSLVMERFTDPSLSLIP